MRLSLGEFSFDIYLICEAPPARMPANNKGAIISDNVDFTLTFFDACVI